MADPQVGVVVVTYLSAGVVGPLLDSIPAATSLPVATVVVDNSPHDDGAEEVVRSHGGATFVRAGSNLGYGSGMNLGARSLPSSVRWLVLANPDLVISPGAIDTLVDAASRHPDAALFGPLIRNPDGTIYPSARKLPSPRTGIGHAMFVRVWPSNPWTTSYRNDLDVVEERSVGWVSGSFMLVRRDAFDAIGGFDEGYFMYFEDVDLGRNLGLEGWKVQFVPSADVVHVGASPPAQRREP